MSIEGDNFLKGLGNVLKIIGYVFAGLYMGGAAILWMFWESYRVGYFNNPIIVGIIVGLTCYFWGRYKGRKWGYYRGVNEGFICGYNYNKNGNELRDIIEEYIPYKSIGTPRGGWKSTHSEAFQTYQAL